MKIDEQCVVSSGDAAELFEFGEKALDEITLFVEVFIVGARRFAVPLGQDNKLAALLDDLRLEPVGVVAFITDCCFCFETVNEFIGARHVMLLAGTANQPDRIAKCITCRVDLGAQAAARPAQTLGMRPPLTLRTPAAC